MINMWKNTWYGLLLGLSWGVACAMDVEQGEAYEGNMTASGEIISVESLPKIAKKEQLPKEVSKSLKVWLKKEASDLHTWLQAEVAAYKAWVQSGNQEMPKAYFKYLKNTNIDQMVAVFSSPLKNGDLIKMLAQFPSPVSEYTKQAPYRRVILQYFKENQNITTHESVNYLFELFPGYVTRIGGVGNRIYSYISGHTLADGIWFDPWGTQGQELMDKNKAGLDDLAPVSTYQTISMYTNYLLLKKYITHNNLSHVATPDTYLVHIPARPKDVQDNNYLVVQKKVDGPLTTLHDHPEAWSRISDEALKDLFSAAKVGLWGVKNNLNVTAQGTFVLLDLEQPNNSDPRAFFNKKMEENSDVWGDIRGARAWARYVVDGLAIIKTMMQEAGKKLADNPTLSALVAQKLSLWKLLIKSNAHFVDQVSASQQERMNQLAND